MTIITEERTKTPVPAGQSSETEEQPAGSPDSQASDAKKETAPGIDFTSPAFRKAVRDVSFSELQSMKDKELTPLKEENAKLRSRIGARAEEKKDTDDANRWIDEGEDEEKVRSWAEARKLYREARRELEDRDAAVTKKDETASASLLYAEAAIDLITELYPEIGAELGEKVKFLISESEGSLKLRKRLAKDIAAEIRAGKKSVAAKAEEEAEEPPSRRADSGISVPGTASLDGLSARELIQKGLSEKVRR